MRILPSGILWVLGSSLLAVSAEARGVESTLGGGLNDTAAICAGLNAAAVDLDTTLYPALQNALSICKKFSPFSSGVQHVVQGVASAASRYGDDSDNTSTDERIRLPIIPVLRIQTTVQNQKPKRLRMYR